MDALSEQLRRNLAALHANLQRSVQDVAAQAAALCQGAHMRRQPSGLAPLLASMSAHVGGAAAAVRRRAQPLLELAFNPEEIKARLDAVPVWVVVNNKNEFVLVSGEAGSNKQLSLFFFTETEAQAMLKTIKEANPKLGKQSKVMATSMDRVYDFARTPRSETDTDGVVFRFVPDPRQVEAALELYRHAGVAATGFQGVPLFQAEGLTIKGDKARYTPLFFSKEDLDAALAAAYSSRDAAAHQETRDKATRARGELADAQKEVEAAKSDRERKAAQRKADQAQQRVSKYEQRLQEAASNQKLPRVDVGSLEEVIGRMEEDEKGEWSDVVFVPARSVAAAAELPKKKK
ncbi:TIC 22- chloroplastic [Chlorella sorokiniana]|uniref:TIC 22-chloroplastic n=1 Tax=Chlorella sorokiniana TaxID=3076 RepID=A0A2P6U578_CHLSO|nr:TIC 22- chloroplastic [Chlorella sorokiniana]|eukprot:PRW61470.1 TIC 22- chloroplastic [Chlorella sorokiniana]